MTDSERESIIQQTRRLCVAWAYWCRFGKIGEAGGRYPRTAQGGIERRYRAPCQWHPPEPRMPEADENAGMAVQLAYIQLPDRPYRSILRAEFHLKPWIIPLRDGELEVAIARKARTSIGAYEITLKRALLALAAKLP